MTKLLTLKPTARKALRVACAAEHACCVSVLSTPPVALLQVHLRHLVGGRARSYTGELPDERIFQVRG